MIIELKKIVPDPEQPRKTFNPKKLTELRDSLGGAGQVDSLVVRPINGDRYMVILGERRWRAAKDAKWPKIECDVRNVGELEAREMQLADAFQHEDILDYEKAVALKQYIETTGISHRKASEKFGIGHQHISAWLKALASVTLCDNWKHNKLKTLEVEQLVRIEDEKRLQEVAEPFAKGEVSSSHITQVVTKAKENPKKPVSEIIEEVVASKQKAKTEVADESRAEAQAETETKSQAKAVAKESAEVTPEVGINLLAQALTQVADSVAELTSKLTGLIIPDLDWNKMQAELEIIITCCFDVINKNEPQRIEQLIPRLRNLQQAECQCSEGLPSSE